MDGAAGWYAGVAAEAMTTVPYTGGGAWVLLMETYLLV